MYVCMYLNSVYMYNMPSHHVCQTLYLPELVLCVDNNMCCLIQLDLRVQINMHLVIVGFKCLWLSMGHPYSI